jgi:anti-sigma-K factor RskA
VVAAADAAHATAKIDGGTVTVYRSEKLGKAALVASDLPPVAAGKVYEMWLQTPDGAMVPAGLMTGGDATVVLEGDAAHATAAGITVEPKGGSTSPTTAPIALFDFERAT